MSYARYRAAAADVEAFSGTRLKWKLRQAEAELRASLPFLGDDIFVLIAAELDARMLGRLACTAPRFWRPSVPDPDHKGKSAPPELWSVAEEGARRRLAAQSEQVRGWVPRETSGGSWLRAWSEAEKLQRPLHFTEHHQQLQMRSRRATWWCGWPLFPLPLPHATRLTLLRVAQGLLLDCDAATLTVWINGERKGVMVRPGMTSHEDGQPVGRLEGPLRWAVDLSPNVSVAIAGPLPLPA
eukprot:COSAG04_NODE_997_length_8867_cov_22.280908_8_plen_240_part_00